MLKKKIEKVYCNWILSSLIQKVQFSKSVFSGCPKCIQNIVLRSMKYFFRTKLLKTSSTQLNNFSWPRLLQWYFSWVARLLGTPCIINLLTNFRSKNKIDKIEFYTYWLITTNLLFYLKFQFTCNIKPICVKKFQINKIIVK